MLSCICSLSTESTFQKGKRGQTHCEESCSSEKNYMNFGLKQKDVDCVKDLAITFRLKH